MDALLAHLETVVGQTRAQVAGALGGGRIIDASDDQVTAALAAAAELSRLTDAVLIEAAGEVARRSTARDRELRLSSRMGCHDVSELIQRLTRLGPATAARLQKAGKAVAVGVSFAGAPMPARLPAMREMLLDGVVGLDGLLAVAGPLEAMNRRVGRDDLLAADIVLASEARGEGPDAAPPACADVLRLQALVWAALLDQDGAEPREDRALRSRGVVFGTVRDGVVPFHGALLPEVAAQFRRICDATGSPRVDRNGAVQFRPAGDIPDAGADEFFAVDTRTGPQQQHDALATALFAAASSGLLPTIGGAAPTLIVSVRAEDLVSDTGWAHLDGTDEPVSSAAARHVGCAGVIQRVLLDRNGRILRLGTEERVFNRHQRRAIGLRDGGCIIPACGVPPGWSEIHHVTEHARGGPAHTDNGVMLCWFHHRFLDLHGWEIRINRGVPEVRAPEWMDPTRQWRTATKSQTRMLDRIAAQS